MSSSTVRPLGFRLIRNFHEASKTTFLKMLCPTTIRISLCLHRRARLSPSSSTRRRPSISLFTGQLLFHPAHRTHLQTPPLTGFPSPVGPPLSRSDRRLSLSIWVVR